MSTSSRSHKPLWPGIAPQIVATLDRTREARAMAGKTIPYEGTSAMSLHDIRQCLIDAERQGEEGDAYEGARYITISDTLARRMVEAINRHLGETE